MLDRDPELAVQYRVSAVPTIVWFDEGREMTRSVGADPVALRRMLSSLCTA